MTEGRDTALILAEWRELERQIEQTGDPFARAELLRRVRRLRSEYARRVDDVSDVAGHDMRSTERDDPADEYPASSERDDESPESEI
jgi:hypothetical protein